MVRSILSQEKCKIIANISILFLILAVPSEVMISILIVYYLLRDINWAYTVATKSDMGI